MNAPTLIVVVVFAVLVGLILAGCATDQLMTDREAAGVSDYIRQKGL